MRPQLGQQLSSQRLFDCADDLRGRSPQQTLVGDKREIGGSRSSSLRTADRYPSGAQPIRECGGVWALHLQARHVGPIRPPIHAAPWMRGERLEE